MSKLIFVTGASGFLASHIVQELLTQGHRVRGTARGKKVEDLRIAYQSTPQVEIVEVSDIAHDQFPEALVGVDAVIHTASPLPGRGDPATLFKSAVDGSLNVLRQAEAAGIKKFIVTGSMAAMIGDPRVKGAAYKADYWNPVTKDLALSNPLFAYSGSKKFAELAVWEWAEAHPHVDVTTVIPPYIYGPLPRLGLRPPTPDLKFLSSNLAIYNLLFPTGQFPRGPSYADVRDVAKVHVGALATPPSVQGRKRIIVTSPHGSVFKDMIEMVREERPDLSSRLITEPAPEMDHDRYDVDFARLQEVAGLKKEDFYPLKDTFLDTIDDLLTLEAEWRANGQVLDRVPPFGQVET